MPLNSQMKIGVLDDTQLLMYSYKSKQYSHNRILVDTEVYSIGNLLDMAHLSDVDTLWITPGSHYSKAGQYMMMNLDRDTFDCYSSKGTRSWPRFLLLWRKNGDLTERKSVKMAWPEWDPRWPWGSCTDAQTLLRSILYLQDAIEAEIAWSPGHVGQEKMLAMINDTWLAPAEIPPVVKKHLALDMTYKRPLTDEEKHMGMYLHLFDGNSKYLAACTSANLGEGDPVHWEGDDIQFNALYPGIWRVGDFDLWTWTPGLEYIHATHDSHLHPDIKEAWVWPRYHQALRWWAEHMWHGRCSLNLNHPDFNQTYHEEHARLLAYEAVKLIYTQGLGWLAMESKQGDNKLYRPDWWSQIVAGVYRSMGFKIRQLRQHGMDVCYVNTDTLGLVSYGADIERYETLLLNRQASLGGFKYVGRVLVTQDIIQMFDDGTPFSKCQSAIVKALEGVRHAEVS